MDVVHNNDDILIQQPCMESSRHSELQASNKDEGIKKSGLTKHASNLQVDKRRKSTATTRSTSIDFVVPSLPKSSIFLQQKKRLDDDYQWDPHIDIFDIIGAKLNGITRLTQELHVQELFHSSLVVEKRERSHLMKCDLHRLYSAKGKDNHEQKYSSIGHAPTYSYDYLEANETAWDNTLSDHKDDRQEIKASPNLTSLFMTTNNLLHSKLAEISEVASVNNEPEDFEWRNQFLSLVTLCIEQSEKLESLSVDILNSEQQVRELLFLSQSLDEQFCKQERYYEERIREYQEAANQQKLMTESLDELAVDINMNIEPTLEKFEKVSEDSIEKVEGTIKKKEKVKRWNFSEAVSNLLHMEEKRDMVHRMRWDVGMLIEGNDDIGHTLCSFETSLNGIDRMIASMGVTTEPVKEKRNEEEVRNHK